MKKIYAMLCIFLLAGCSSMGSLATDALVGSVLPTKDGVELTAQVGKENQKGLVTTKVDTSKEVDVGDIKGDAVVDTSSTVTNEAKTMIGLVLAGMLPPLLLLFYLLPAPRWLQRRHYEAVSPNTRV
ncbi:Rz-like spanin [Vibrio phage D530]